MFLDLSPWLTFYILTASLILSTIRFVVLGLTQSLPTSLSIDKLDTFRESIFFPGRYLSIYPLLPPLSNTIKNQSWTLVVSQSCSCRLFYSTITSYCLTKVSCLTLVITGQHWRHWSVVTGADDDGHSSVTPATGARWRLWSRDNTGAHLWSVISWDISVLVCIHCRWWSVSQLMCPDMCHQHWLLGI